MKRLPTLPLPTVFLFAGTAFALAASQPATITQVHKEVSLASGKHVAAGDNMPAGQTLVTGRNSRAEIRLNSGAVTRVGQGSSIALDDSMISLRSGSALLHPAGKKITLKTPALTCAATTGILSVHAAKNYEACFFLDGSGSVNGVALGAGQALVLENGRTRTIAFDVQRMLATSALVTKFNSAPWVARALSGAALQREQLAANRAETARLAGREQQTGMAGNTRASSASANTSNTGFLAGLFGHRVASSDSARTAWIGSIPLTSNGSSNSLGEVSRGSTRNTIGGMVTSGAGTTVSGGTLTLNGSNTNTGATGIRGGYVVTGAGTAIVPPIPTSNPGTLTGGTGLTIPGGGNVIQIPNGGVTGTTTPISVGTLPIHQGTSTLPPGNGTLSIMGTNNLLMRGGNAHP